MIAVPPEAAAAAQAYDLAHRSDDPAAWPGGWRRIGDAQVLRLLEGAAPLLVLGIHAEHDRRVIAAEREQIRRLAAEMGATYQQMDPRAGLVIRDFADLLGGDQP